MKSTSLMPCSVFPSPFKVVASVEEEEVVSVFAELGTLVVTTSSFSWAGAAVVSRMVVGGLGLVDGRVEGVVDGIVDGLVGGAVVGVIDEVVTLPVRLSWCWLQEPSCVVDSKKSTFSSKIIMN